MATFDYNIGGVAHNSMGIDADGSYLYIATVSGGVPKLVRQPADLSDIGIVTHDGVNGERMNVACSDLDTYFIVISGDFNTGARVSLAEDGFYFYPERDTSDFQYWYNAAEPLLLGPANDNIITTFTNPYFVDAWATMHTSYWVDGGLYWFDAPLPITVGAVDRYSVDPNDAMVGNTGYWYDEVWTIIYTPDSGASYGDISTGLTNVYWVTAIDYGV